MAALSPDVSAALASLQARWGAAAPRVVGALATAPLPDGDEAPAEAPRTGVERIVRTGFPELDAILGPGGLPRSASVARGVRLDWLVVLTPDTLDEGLSIAGALLAGRSVDLLVVDLPPHPDPGTTAAKVADRLRRLAALARRAETLLVALEPPGLTPGLATAVAESTGLRLELARRAWIRLGRDVVGQRTEALVARSRYGPPGRRAELRILYAEGGERDRCLRHPDLLRDDPGQAVAPVIALPGIP